MLSNSIGKCVECQFWLRSLLNQLSAFRSACVVVFIGSNCLCLQSALNRIRRLWRRIDMNSYCNTVQKSSSVNNNNNHKMVERTKC